MFLRKITTKNKTYLSIVESYREDGKVKQRSIACLGSLNSLKEKSEHIIKIAHALLAYCGNTKAFLVDDLSITERSRKKWGCVRVFRKLWNDFAFDTILNNIRKKTKIQFDFFSAVFLMIIDRLQDPKSKRASCIDQDTYYGIRENKLHHLYRALDVLADHKESLEAHMFGRQRDLFHMMVDVCLYDVTTLYFESVRTNPLSEFGYSKDCKFNEVQVVLGLLVDIEGRPIGFDLFPGNTYEGNTLTTALEKLKDRYKIQRIIIVGDQGMCSKEGIAEIAGKGFSYIVGSRIKTKSKKLKEAILDKESYQDIPADKEEDILKYKIIDGEKDKIICTWSSRRAKKNRKDRERLVAKAQKLVKGKNALQISGRGAMKYIEIETEKEPTLREDKILSDEAWDGFYGIQTNCSYSDPRTILGYYHDLWRVEESFRIFKSHLETRPVFHWTEKRIRGHMVLCFIAFALERSLESILRAKHVTYSPLEIRKALDTLEVSEIDIEGKKYNLRSTVGGLANKILRALKLNIPPSITTPDNF